MNQTTAPQQQRRSSPESEESMSVPKKRVTFYESVKVFLVAPLYTRETRDTAWYVDEDFRGFKKEIKHIQRNQQKGRSLQHVCLRGIEHLVDPQLRERRHVIREEVFMTVMTEQHVLGSSSELLATSVAKETKASRYDALSRAVNDTEVANRLYSQTFTKEELSSIATKFSLSTYRDLVQSESSTPSGTGEPSPILKRNDGPQSIMCKPKPTKAAKNMFGGRIPIGPLTSRSHTPTVPRIA